MPTNFSKFISDFSNKIFVSRPKFLKKYSPGVFFKDELKLYVFESLKRKYKFKFEKQDWKSMKFDFKGYIFAVTHIVTQLTHVLRHLKV